METIESTQLRKILLDHYDTPINITLSTPTPLKNYCNGTEKNKNSPANNSDIKKMEDYKTKKYDEATLNHLRRQILKEVTQNVDEKIKSHKLDKTNTSGTTALLKTHIQTLVSKIYFLRSELQEKNVIIKSLIALNTKPNNSKQVFSEPSINTYPNLNNDKNSKSLLDVPGKESSIDFQVKESHVVQPEEEHRVLIPLSDREKESDTSVSDKQSKAETVPLSDAIINKNEQKDILAKKEEINKNNDGLEPAEKTSDEKRIFIVGDSIIKNVNGYEVSGKTDHCRVYIRPCLGAKVRCMEDHIKPVLGDKPDHIIFHIGTNDIPSNKKCEDIANSIIELVLSAKSESCDASISNIVVRKDRHQNKCQQVNDHLKEKCREKNINLIDHSKSIKSQHLNKSRLHLTKKGTSILSSTFIREIKNIFQ